MSADVHIDGLGDAIDVAGARVLPDVVFIAEVQGVAVLGDPDVVLADVRKVQRVIEPAGIGVNARAVPRAADRLAEGDGAGRALGYVCAPSLFQRVAARCADLTSDIAVYRTNRDLLYSGLTEMGYTCVKPEGAFYLFVKSPVENEKEFCEVCKQYNVLVVPGSSFACPGYVRIAYCVSYGQIERSLPAFRKIAEHYNLV